MSHTKAARISPESRPVAFAAAGVAAAIYIGAFAASFSGLASLAAFMAIPVALQFVVPVVVDLAVVLFTLATLLRRARGQSTWKTNAATAFWILVSMSANTFHVLVAAGPASSWNMGTCAGATLSALMPLSGLGAGLVLENLFIEDAARAESAVAVRVAEVAAPSPAVTVAAPVAVPVAIAPAPVITGERPEPVRTEIPVAPRLAVAAAAAPRKSVVASVPTLSKTLAAPDDLKASAADAKAVKDAWAAASSKEEQTSIAQGLKDAGKSNPQIAIAVGASLSTIKRLPLKTPSAKLLEASA
ncbi:MAG TPA: DUF2637 domain-containing protein [Arthrobacter sp.]